MGKYLSNEDIRDIIEEVGLLQAISDIDFERIGDDAVYDAWRDAQAALNEIEDLLDL